MTGIKRSRIMMRSARELYETGELVAAARKEADACDEDGYDITAAILRDLADKVESTEAARV